MGNKVSAVRGVKSDHFYNQGNAINEIWVGDVEIISRLPFGDSDLEQAGWPIGGFPKIPWRHFIIPMHKRDEVTNMTTEHTAGDRNITINWTISAGCDTMPKDGLFEWFTRIFPPVTHILGSIVLDIAIVMFTFFALMTVKHFAHWVVLRKMSVRRPDPARFQRQIWRDLSDDLGRGYLGMGVCCCLFLLGLPPVAVAWRGVEAPVFIFTYGLTAGAVILVIVCVVQPLAFLLIGRRVIKRYPVEDSRSHHVV
ncbi:hypothetical protein N7535_005843 [Penicillium sp. DV-2018c]|nr:hypothetical protein N7461_009419 [Penicillium sp. DV-2018c]KAJ5572183.1 hypothetical protein N7535_005843 [Penicillium sp. DV-2018c]